MDTQKSSVHRASAADEGPHPHACTDGVVYLGYVVYDLLIGAEVERIETVPCRRCEVAKATETEGRTS